MQQSVLYNFLHHRKSKTNENERTSTPIGILFYASLNMLACLIKTFASGESLKKEKKKKKKKKSKLSEKENEREGNGTGLSGDRPRE